MLRSLDVKMFQSDSRWLGTAVGATCLILFSPLTGMWDEFWLRAFCFPAAHLASLFLGAACERTGDMYTVLVHPLPINVIPGCSGGGFFVLLTSMGMAMAIDADRSRWWRDALWLLPSAYALTVVANTARVVIAWMARTFVRTWLPEDAWSGVHAAAGVLVFLFFLIAAFILLKWRLNDERR